MNRSLLIIASLFILSGCGGSYVSLKFSWHTVAPAPAPGGPVCDPTTMTDASDDFTCPTLNTARWVNSLATGVINNGITFSTFDVLAANYRLTSAFDIKTKMKADTLLSAGSANAQWLLATDGTHYASVTLSRDTTNGTVAHFVAVVSGSVYDPIGPVILDASGALSEVELEVVRDSGGAFTVTANGAALGTETIDTGPVAHEYQFLYSGGAVQSYTIESVSLVSGAYTL